MVFVLMLAPKILSSLPKRREKEKQQYICATMLLSPKKPHRSEVALIYRQKYKQMIPKKTYARKKVSCHIEMARYRRIQVPA